MRRPAALQAGRPDRLQETSIMRKQSLPLLATLCLAAPLALAQPVVSLFVA
jgi:hypothetical protein